MALAVPVNFASPITACAPTTFSWTGGIPPFRLNVTAADVSENSGLVFGISFDGLLEQQFAFSVPFPAGTSASFNVLSNSSAASIAPPSIITSNFTVGGDFSLCTLGIQNDIFSSTSKGGGISLSGVNNSTESCESSGLGFDWTGGTPPFHARFALKSAPNGNLPVTQNATIDVTGITRNGIIINLPYDTGATVGLSVSEENAIISTDLSKAKSIFIEAGGFTNCFLQASPSTSKPFSLGGKVGSGVGGFFLVVSILWVYRRLRRPTVVQTVYVEPVYEVEPVKVEPVHVYEVTEVTTLKYVQ